MITLEELQSRALSEGEIKRIFSKFGACDFCSIQEMTCRYRSSDAMDQYVEGLICVSCYEKIRDKNTT